jgi:hypothetical protein
MDFLEDELTGESVIDLTADYEALEDFLTSNSLTFGDDWVGVQFLGSEEIPVDVGATNTRGKYRETGTIFLHVVDVASLGVHTLILTRGETIRDKLRGRRIGNVVIEGVSPVNFGEGITLSFTGGYTAGVIQVDYHRDLDL